MMILSAYCSNCFELGDLLLLGCHHLSSTSLARLSAPQPPQPHKPPPVPVCNAGEGGPECDECPAGYFNPAPGTLASPTTACGRCPATQTSSIDHSSCGERGRERERGGGGDRPPRVCRARGARQSGAGAARARARPLGRGLADCLLREGQATSCERQCMSMFSHSLTLSNSFTLSPHVFLSLSLSPQSPRPPVSRSQSRRLLPRRRRGHLHALPARLLVARRRALQRPRVHHVRQRQQHALGGGDVACGVQW